MNRIITWVSSPVGLSVAAYMLKILAARVKARKQLPTSKQTTAINSVRSGAIHFANGKQSLKPFVTMSAGDLKSIESMSAKTAISKKALNKNFISTMVITAGNDGKHTITPIVPLSAVSSASKSTISGGNIAVSG